MYAWPVHLSPKSGCILASLFLVLGVAARAQSEAPRRGQAIHFSAPKSEMVQSNLNALSTGNKADLQRIEEGLRKPFEFFPAESSLDGVRTRIRPHLPPPAINSQKARELLDKKRNWIYMEDREIEGAPPTPEEVFGVDQMDPESALRKQRTAMERYYHERLDRERAAASNSVAAPNTNGSFEGKEPEDPFVANLLNRSQGENMSSDTQSPSLGRLFEADKDEANALAEMARPRSIPQMMGYGSAPALPVRPEVREARVNEFKQILGTDPQLSPATGLATDPFKSFNSSPAPVVRPSLPSAFAAPSPGAIRTTPGFAATPESEWTRSSGLAGLDVNGGFSSLAPKPPPAPRPTALPPPKFEAPRRAF